MAINRAVQIEASDEERAKLHREEVGRGVLLFVAPNQAWARRPSSAQALVIRSSSSRSEMSSAYICNRPEHAVVLCVEEQSQIKRWTAPRRSCRCSQKSPSAPRTAASTQPPPAVGRAEHRHRAGRRSLYANHPRLRPRSSCRPSTARSPATSTFTSCWTRRWRSRSGCWTTPGRLALHPNLKLMARSRRARPQS